MVASSSRELVGASSSSGSESGVSSDGSGGAPRVARASGVSDVESGGGGVGGRDVSRGYTGNEWHCPSAQTLLSFGICSMVIGLTTRSFWNMSPEGGLKALLLILSAFFLLFSGCSFIGASIVVCRDNARS